MYLRTLWSLSGQFKLSSEACCTNEDKNIPRLIVYYLLSNVLVTLVRQRINELLVSLYQQNNNDINCSQLILICFGAIRCFSDVLYLSQILKASVILRKIIVNLKQNAGIQTVAPKLVISRDNQLFQLVDFFINRCID